MQDFHALAFNMHLIVAALPGRGFNLLKTPKLIKPNLSKYACILITSGPSPVKKHTAQSKQIHL